MRSNKGCISAFEEELLSSLGFLGKTVRGCIFGVVLEGLFGFRAAGSALWLGFELLALRRSRGYASSPMSEDLALLLGSQFGGCVLVLRSSRGCACCVSTFEVAALFLNVERVSG